MVVVQTNDGLGMYVTGQALLTSVALAAASIGLIAGGWLGGVIAGIGNAVLLVAVLKIRRLQNETMRFARWIVDA